MNESETRAELIDPALKASGWGVVEGSRVRREQITEGRIQAGGLRAKPMIADYVLVYKNQKLAVIEAKSDEKDVTEGVQQAKDYAEKLKLHFAYSTNGKEIYQINCVTGKEEIISKYPTPDELWNEIYSDVNEWREKFSAIPYEDIGGSKNVRYYQEIAVNKTMNAIAENKDRILLTLATGTGKTFIAFQIAWKLFHSRWNLKRDGTRRPRILFLADRNILANQAFNAFSAFSEDALVRINPADIRKKGKVPTNGSIFFTIFQSFMSGPNDTPYFGEYPQDYFDFIVIDECHRGGANDESQWRDILDYFSPAVQLGLTATPKRKDNIDTYKYFGEPVYIYSLKEGINDGFLTPFKVKRIKTTLDDYVYTSDDEVIEGMPEEGKRYKEPDFNVIIEIEARERKRVLIMLNEIDQNEKTIIFCKTQLHALAVRNLVNQNKTNPNPDYCVRVTADEGETGEKYLREFQDNEKTIPTILTTSQKLSTGVDARNIRNIVLMRPIKQMIEFKQIIGRGTRLFEGKNFFTIYDFVNAYEHFSDPEWDGEPIDNTKESEPKEPKEPKPKPPRPERIKIKLADGKEREIQHMISTSFWSPTGKPMSAQEFLQSLFGELKKMIKSEDELRAIWSIPKNRHEFLEKISALGFGPIELTELQKLINAEKSDIYDVLAYVSFAVKPITRAARVENSEAKIYEGLDSNYKEFIEFVLANYIESGVKELDEEKLPHLLELKYQSIMDGIELLKGVEQVRETFINFQKYLY
ncbi:MAG: DEAD/DEAH box helicase family protein [Ignavibacteria bacterium]